MVLDETEEHTFLCKARLNEQKQANGITDSQAYIHMIQPFHHPIFITET